MLCFCLHACDCAHNLHGQQICDALLSLQSQQAKKERSKDRGDFACERLPAQRHGKLSCMCIDLLTRKKTYIDACIVLHHPESTTHNSHSRLALSFRSVRNATADSCEKAASAAPRARASTTRGWSRLDLRIAATAQTPSCVVFGHGAPCEHHDTVRVSTSCMHACVCNR